MTSREDRANIVQRILIEVVYQDVAISTAADRIVDALLPQITTVEQLDWLLASISHNAAPAVVVDSHNRAWTVFEDDRGDWHAQRLGDQDEPRAVTIELDLDEWPALSTAGPLTVVWQP